MAAGSIFELELACEGTGFLAAGLRFAGGTFVVTGATLAGVVATITVFAGAGLLATPLVAGVPPQAAASPAIENNRKSLDLINYKSPLFIGFAVDLLNNSKTLNRRAVKVNF